MTEAWSRLKKHHAALASAGVILLLTVVAILAPLIAPHSYDEQFLDQVLASPNGRFWLGTDSLGRDMFSRLIFGARVSMAVAYFTAILSLLIGTFYGTIAGWLGGWVDSGMMRFVDLLESIPSLVLLILVKVIFDSYEIVADPQIKSIMSMLLALSLVSWVTLARTVRSQVLQVKEMPYVEGAKAAGSSGVHIILAHVLPNILGPVIVLLTFQIPANILAESFMSFLGLGLQPPYASWGVLANDGWRTLRSFPHLMIAPGVAIFIAMLSFNLLGDGLRDALDPQMRGRQ
jgi:oligopeptide transport system permease protein